MKCSSPLSIALKKQRISKYSLKLAYHLIKLSLERQFHSTCYIQSGDSYFKNYFPWAQRSVCCGTDLNNQHSAATFFVPTEMYFIEPKLVSSKYQYQESLLVRPPFVLQLWWPQYFAQCVHLFLKQPLSLGYSYRAELLSPYSPQRPWMVSGPVRFNRSLYAEAQVTR